MVVEARSLTLESFLQLPETKPASEFIDGAIVQKPMPKARHSRLQSELLTAINSIAGVSRVAYAFPELRCTFGGRSIVPDIAVLRWSHIEFDEQGEPLDDIIVAPDWTIEILSPGQSAHRVTGKILHCLEHGCQLGWSVDPGDRSILVFRPQRQPECLRQEDAVDVLDGLDLKLSANQIFGWLQMGTS